MGTELPPQRPLDFLTRLDELLVENLAAIKALNGVVPQLKQSIGGKPSTMNLQDTRKALENGELSHYEIRTLKMDAARNDEKLVVEGDFLHAWTDGTLDEVYVRLNQTQAGPLYFERRNPIVSPFFVIYLTHAAQVGKTLDLMIGREASASASTTEISVTITQRIHSLSTDKDTHFTGAIAQGAKEDENITGLLGDKIRLTGLTFQSDQPLDYYLMFWRTDGFDDADLDLDKFAGMVHVPLATSGKQVGGAGQYYYSIEGVNLDYEDEDETKELHVSLYNASATAKAAGAAGEVVVHFKYELRS